MALRLHQAVEESRWSDVREILAERPEEARERDRLGRLPLHRAAEAQALLSIQRVLFEAYPLGILTRDAALSYTPVDYTRSGGRVDPDALQTVETWAAIVEAATQQSWGPLRARQLSQPAEWVPSLAVECGAKPGIRDDLVTLGKLSRALSRRVRISHADARCNLLLAVVPAYITMA